MNIPFFEKLEKRARAIDSLVCVGLDPRGSSPQQIESECLRLIDLTADVALAYKPNSAFFEVWGAEGWFALKNVIAHVPADIPVILDAKRGDIADTSEAYARASFDGLGAHAITLSPYLGGEAIAPFLARPDYAGLILCKTSNPGADEFQMLPVRQAPEETSLPMFEAVAQSVSRWSRFPNVGLVVGATDPRALQRVRELAPDLWILVPGVGAQGGDLEATMKAGLKPDGLGLLINASRSIARAADPGAEARRLRDEINRYRA